MSRRDLFRIAGAIAKTVGVVTLAEAVSPLINTGIIRLPILETPRAEAAGPIVEESVNTTMKRKAAQWGVEALGGRTTETWDPQDGFQYMAFQRAILQRDPRSGDIRLWNTLDEMHNRGMNARLDNGSLGVTIPPQVDMDDRSGGSLDVAFANRVKAFEVPSDILGYVNNFRGSFETGVFTSPGKDYGSYEVWRLQRMAVMRWKDSGLIQGILAGDAAKAAGIVPADVRLTAVDLNFANGGGVAESPKPNPAPVSAPEAPKVQVPDLPSGGIHDNQYPDELRQITLRYMTRFYKETPLSIQGSGVITGWDIGDNQIVLHIDISGDRKDIPLKPTSGNRISWYAARSSEILFYQSPDMATTVAALQKYLRLGDPMSVAVRVDGTIQRVTTFE